MGIQQKWVRVILWVCSCQECGRIPVNDKGIQSRILTMKVLDKEKMSIRLMLRAIKEEEAGLFTLQVNTYLITLEQYLCVSTNSRSPFFLHVLGDEHTEKRSKAHLRILPYYNVTLM